VHNVKLSLKPVVYQLEQRPVRLCGGRFPLAGNVRGMGQKPQKSGCETGGGCNRSQFAVTLDALPPQRLAAAF
jgi:hypothetical protein